jgi:hypothetical protein
MTTINANGTILNTLNSKELAEELRRRGFFAVLSRDPNTGKITIETDASVETVRLAAIRAGIR